MDSAGATSTFPQGITIINQRIESWNINSSELTDSERQGCNHRTAQQIVISPSLASGSVGDDDSGSMEDNTGDTNIFSQGIVIINQRIESWNVNSSELTDSERQGRNHRTAQQIVISSSLASGSVGDDDGGGSIKEDTAGDTSTFPQGIVIINQRIESWNINSSELTDSERQWCNHRTAQQVVISPSLASGSVGDDGSGSMEDNTGDTSTFPQGIVIINQTIKSWNINSSELTERQGRIPPQASASFRPDSEAMVSPVEHVSFATSLSDESMGQPAPPTSGQPMSSSPSTSDIHSSHLEHIANSHISVGGDFVRHTYINSPQSSPPINIQVHVPSPLTNNVNNIQSPGLASTTLAGIGVASAAYFFGRAQEIHSTSEYKVRLEYCNREFVSLKDAQHGLLLENSHLKSQQLDVANPTIQSDSEATQKPPPIQLNQLTSYALDISHLILMDYLVRYFASDVSSFLWTSARQRRLGVRVAGYAIGWKTILPVTLVWFIAMHDCIISLEKK